MYALAPFFYQRPPTAPSGAHRVVGWADSAVGRKRRIPVEQLREILKAQGSPWADQLADTVEAVEPKSAKHAEVLEEVVERVIQKASQPAPIAVDWGPLVASVRASQEATRTTLAIKHAEAALRALQAEEDDDEEAIMLLSDWMM